MGGRKENADYVRKPIYTSPLKNGLLENQGLI